MDIKFIKNWFYIFSQKVEENKNFLTELDVPIGDSDHGNNLYRGVVALKENVLNEEYDDSNELFRKIAMELMSKVGGASGALYGSAILNISKDKSNYKELSDFIRVGMEAIKKRGKAEIGDKTMVDIWNSVLNKLKETDYISKEDLFNMVNETKDMKALKGRASYVGERSIGHIDPGTYSSSLLFQSYFEAKENFNE